mmetsp:Transcript_20309/g.41522  ORF Transcript_20309/g.41522 Transcript_20309/m.41522 type:complete len:103 (+) Transcript_20309:301-609(+)
MEDLEGLGATCSGGGQNLAVSADGAGSSTSGSCYTSGTEEGGTDDDEDMSIQVHDLVPPVTSRAEHEMEWKEGPAADEGFEVINWDDEMRAIRGPRNVVMAD